MARNVNLETTAMARRFVEKFGHTEITVDQLDMFLVDEGVLPQIDFDPERVKSAGLELTPEQRSQWSGFVQSRANGRNMLNRGGRQLANGEAFALSTLRSGKSYSIRRFSSSARSYATNDMGEKVREYTQGRLNDFLRIKRQLDWQAENNLLEDLDAEFWEVSQMYSILETQAKLLNRKIDALTRQYGNAVDAAVDQAKILLERAGHDVPQLEDQSASDDDNSDD